MFTNTKKGVIIYTDQNKSETNPGGNRYEVQQKSNHEKSMGNQERKCKKYFFIMFKDGMGKDIREKMIAKLDLGSLLTARGELATDEVECLVGLIFSSAIGDYREKSNWAKKLNEKKNDCSASLDLYIQTESLKEMTLAERLTGL